MEYLGLIFGAVFLSNILLSTLVGFPIIDKKTKFNDIVVLGIKTIVLSIVTVLITYPLNKYIIIPINREFLLPLLTILIVLNFNIVMNILIDKLSLKIEKDNDMNLFVPLNATVIAVLLVSLKNTNLLGTFLQTLGLSGGYLLILLLLFTMKPRLEMFGVPKAFKGIPLILITLGLMGMVFVGLAGIF